MADKIEGTDLVEKVETPQEAPKMANDNEPVRTKTATKGDIRDFYIGNPVSYAQVAEKFDVTTKQVEEIVLEYQATLTPEDA